MQFNIEHVLLIGSILLFLSILVSKTTGMLSIPLLILFLGIGMLAGVDGMGIRFDNFPLAQGIGVVSLVFILFSGGLDTKWESIKPILGKGLSLSTVGVLVTAFSVGIFVHYVTSLSLLEGLLLGGIVSSTDAAAVFSILRSQGIGLKKNLKPLLELESGSNDPMAYFLTIGFTFLLITPAATFTDLIPMLIKEITLGSLIGIVMGKIMVWLINRIRLNTEGLYPVLVISLVFMTYSVTHFFKGNGFLAVYIAGLILGNKNFIHKNSIIKFYDGQAWLVQIIMFLTMGLLVYPKKLIPIADTGLLISIFLMFVARPLGVYISLIPFRTSLREKLFISWVGLRGAVPIIFATYPLIAGVEKANMIFNLVFFIVLTSVTLQGTTLSWVAKKLNLFIPEKRKILLRSKFADDMRNELFEVEVPFGSRATGRTIVQLGLPKNTLIVMIKREEGFITPNGNTEIKSGDRLTIMANANSDAEKINQVLDIS